MVKNYTYSANLLRRNFKVSPSNQIPRAGELGVRVAYRVVVLPLLCSAVFVHFLLLSRTKRKMKKSRRNSRVQVANLRVVVWLLARRTRANAIYV
jgi:hypothetical protein